MNVLKCLSLTTALVTLAAGCSPLPRKPSLHTPDRPEYRVYCDDVKNYASVSGSSAYAIEFYNVRSAPVDLFWIDYDGAEVLTDTIPAGEIRGQNTFITHPWVVRDKAGNCIAAYHSASKVTVEIR